MLSKPASSRPSCETGWLSTRRTACPKAPQRDLVGAVAKELRARVGIVFPLLEGGCGVCTTPTLREAEVPKISTTVRHPRQLRIRTTVVEHRRSQRSWLQADNEAAASRNFVGRASGVSLASDSLVPYVADKVEDDDTKSNRMMILAKDAMVSFAPLFIMAPLQLLSPWAGLGGVSMAMMAPPGGPPPGFQMKGGAMGMPGMPKEEDHFMELIFPGWDAGAFVWQITCWQTAQFVLSMLLGHQKANPTPCVLYALGASWGPAVARGQIWRLITPVFLHANLTHLLFNIFFQLRMGFGMEKQFGRDKMMMIYFACGIFGNLMSINVDPFKLAVGASTAGFGLIGVWLAEILLSWEILGPARERTIIWIVFMLISVTTMSTMTPNMDLWGHLGGALGGFLLSIVISDMKEEDRPEWYSQVRAAAALGLAIFLVGGLGRVALVGPRTPIPDCPLFPGQLPSGLQAAFEKVLAVGSSAATH